ncbi:putative glutamine synthetase [Helianthus anomalus]
MPESRGSKLNINNSSGFVRLRSKFGRLGGQILIKEGHNIDHEFHFTWTAYGPVYVMLGVMCDAYTPDGEPISTNKRCAAVKNFSNPEVEKEVPWITKVAGVVVSFDRSSSRSVLF